MKKEEILFLTQLIVSLEEAQEKLEKAFKRKDYDQFNQSKKIIIRVQKEISNLLI